MVGLRCARLHPTWRSKSRCCNCAKSPNDTQQRPADRTWSRWRELNICLAAGEFLAVTGPSGSGKSTLLLIAGGLLTPSSGRVLCEGRDVYSLTAEGRARWRAENLGFVFQQFHLIPYLSAYENILAPTLGLAVKDAPHRAEELMERFGLADRRNHVPATLSTGEQQRVALARACCTDPGCCSATSQPATSTSRTAPRSSTAWRNSSAKAVRCCWSPTTAPPPPGRGAACSCATGARRL